MCRMLFLVISLSFFCICSAQLPHVKCRTKHKKIGCFDRNVPGANLLFSDHYLGGPKNKGYEVDWYNWDIYMHSLACRCNEDALSQGYSHFFLDYLGYCLGVNDTSTAMNRSSLACMSRNFTQCVDSTNVECVGNDKTYYLYEVGRDGGYGEWGRFSACSQTCDFGIKTRTRSCTNPAPTGHGRNCSYIGPAKDDQPCNIIYCRDINECASNPCRNGGTCVDHLLSYTCSCVGGYTGTHCQLDANECASNPCLRGICHNGVNKFTCECYYTATGDRCQDAIFSASAYIIPHPCASSGSSIDCQFAGYIRRCYRRLHSLVCPNADSADLQFCYYTCSG